MLKRAVFIACLLSYFVYSFVFFFFLKIRPPPNSTLFPYPTLFRSLPDPVLFEAEKVAQCEQLLLGRVAWGVFALGRVGKFSFRPEHVAVRVDRARRRGVFRLRRVGGKGNVARTHRHGGASFKSAKRAPARAKRPAPRRRTWWRARADPLACASRAPRSGQGARPACRAGARARLPRRGD